MPLRWHFRTKQDFPDRLNATTSIRTCISPDPSLNSLRHFHTPGQSIIFVQGQLISPVSLLYSHYDAIISHPSTPI